MKRSTSTRDRGVSYRHVLIDKKEQILAGSAPRFDSGAKREQFAEEDQAQLSHDEFVSLHLNSLDYLRLRLIEEALDRLGSGHYGVCLACEEPIPAKRLDALPWARYCVACQDAIGALEERNLLDDRRGVFALHG